MLLLTGLIALPASAKGHREIHGQVISYNTLFIGAVTFYPVQSVVEVYNENMKLVDQVVSDQNGNFNISGLKPGTYVLWVSSLNPRVNFGRFLPATRTITITRKDDYSLNFILHFIPD